SPRPDCRFYFPRAIATMAVGTLPERHSARAGGYSSAALWNQQIALAGAAFPQPLSGGPIRPLRLPLQCSAIPQSALADLSRVLVDVATRQPGFGARGNAGGRGLAPPVVALRGFHGGGADHLHQPRRRPGGRGWNAGG